MEALTEPAAPVTDATVPAAHPGTPGLAWVLLAQLSSAQSLPQLDQRIEIDAPTAAKLTGALSVSGAGARTHYRLT